MEEAKKYRLLKDMPGFNAGEIFKKKSNDDSITGYYESVIKGAQYSIRADILEDNPDWFVEVKEKTYYMDYWAQGHEVVGLIRDAVSTLAGWDAVLKQQGFNEWIEENRGRIEALTAKYTEEEVLDFALMLVDIECKEVKCLHCGQDAEYRKIYITKSIKERFKIWRGKG